MKRKVKIIQKNKTKNLVKQQDKKMGISALCEKIEMPEEAVIELQKVSYPTFFKKKLYRLRGMLSRKEKYDKAYWQLKEFLAEDEKGFCMLRVMLETALKSKVLYQKKGIEEDVYIQTMKCFSRFVHEYQESFGFCGFDRGFWTGRQLSLQLFRLGTLEYELSQCRNGKTEISLHIPTDALLDEKSINESIETAKKFFARFYPEYVDAEYVCNSWLLSPAIDEVLPLNSRIRIFKSRFCLKSINEEDEEYKFWIYKNRDLAVEKFPGNTTLQRNLKYYLLRGGKMGTAFGVLKR